MSQLLLRPLLQPFSIENQWCKTKSNSVFLCLTVAVFYIFSICLLCLFLVSHIYIFTWSFYFGLWKFNVVNGNPVLPKSGWIASNKLFIFDFRSKIWSSLYMVNYVKNTFSKKKKIMWKIRMTKYCLTPHIT